MYNASSHFYLSSFRNQKTVWFLLVIFFSSFLPSAGFAQQPTATINTIQGDVLVSGKVATIGAILQAGDTIQIQSGASVVLELSDGSTIELGENTELNLAELTKTTAGARVSRLNLFAGRLRAFLSPGHQQKGSAFNVETPNAQVGAKFSKPDIEVSYSPTKSETIGVAHTVELIAKNLLTGETKIVPVGSSVIIAGTAIKIVTGIITIGSSSSTGTSGTGSSGMVSAGIGTGAKVAIGIGAAAALGGGVALAGGSGGGSDGSSSEGNDDDTDESTGDLSGRWGFSGTCVAQGCTDDLVCPPENPEYCGTGTCDLCDPNWYGQVNQSGNTLSGIMTGGLEHRLRGVINGSSVSITITPASMLPAGPDTSTNYTGIIDGNTIRGDFTGSGNVGTWGGGSEFVTWSGTFAVDIQK